jgi:hypothetical protein
MISNNTNAKPVHTIILKSLHGFMMHLLTHMKSDNSMVVYGITAHIVAEMDVGCVRTQMPPIAQLTNIAIQSTMTHVRHPVDILRIGTSLTTNLKNIIGIEITTLVYEVVGKHAPDLDLCIHQDHLPHTPNLIGMFLFGLQHQTSHKHNYLFSILSPISLVPSSKR